MPEYSWQEVANGGLDAAPAPVKSAVAAARSFACQLYRDYEGFFGNTAPQGPLEGLKRGIWDKVCSGGLPPVPPAPPPWNGDTCACAEYEVTTIPRSATSRGTESTRTVMGPIFGIRTSGSPPGATSDFLQHGSCVGGQFGGLVETSIGGSGDGSFKAVILRSNRVGGPSPPCLTPQPDTPLPPPPPPPDRQREVAPINISPGINISVPVILVRPTLNVDINPSVEVNVGPFNINFGLGGIRVDISPTFAPVILTPPVPLPPLPPGIPRPPALPPAGGNCPDPCEEFDYARIEAAIARERKFYAKPKTRFLSTVLATANAGKVPLPARSRFIRLTLTKEPNSVKEQAGSGGPNVLYAGWVSWGRGTPGERIPLSYRDNTFVLPPDMSEFSWTTYKGAIAQVSVVVEEDLSECQTSTCSVPSG